MPSTEVEFVEGTQAFLQALLTGLLPGLNAKIAAKVTAPAPVFAVRIGDAPNAGQPLLCTSLTANRAVRTAQSQKIVTVFFKVQALIPTSGGNTPASFEMARQASASCVLTAFDDDGLVLTPKIDAGLFGTVQAFAGERGDLLDIWPRTMADGKTLVRGWQMSYSLSFSLQTR